MEHQLWNSFSATDKQRLEAVIRLYCHVRDIVDKDKLQSGIDKFVKWTDKWQVKLNIDKCKVISIHHRR